MKNRICFAILAGLMVFSLAATSAVAGNDLFPIPVQDYEGIRYISGGFGYDERTALQTMGRGYGLKLMFSVKDGTYLSNVGVAINNAAGVNVLQIAGVGPWVFIDLPPQTYRVTVSAMGRSMVKSARVGYRHQTLLHFVW